MKRILLGRIPWRPNKGKILQGVWELSFLFFTAPADFESLLKLLKDENFFEREKFFKMNIESERETLLKDEKVFERENLGGHFSDFHIDFRPTAFF